MFRWLIVVLLALIIFSGLQPWLQKLGFGRLPGDLRFRLFGREWFIPITSRPSIAPTTRDASGTRRSPSPPRPL